MSEQRKLDDGVGRTDGLKPPPTRWLLRGADREVGLPLGTLRVGRSLESDLVLDTALASRHHAVLLVRDDSIVVQDDGSVNGVFVNGRRILGSEVVRSGDEVRFGDATFILVQQAKLPLSGAGPRLRERLSTDGIDTLVQIIDRNAARRDEAPRRRSTRPPSQPLPQVTTERPPPKISFTPRPTMPRSDPFEHQRHLEGAADADAKLAQGDVAGAERALLPALARVRGQVVDGAPVAPELARSAAIYAGRLGLVTGKEGWVNFPARLYGRLRVPPPDDVLDVLEALSVQCPSFAREDVVAMVRQIESSGVALEDSARERLGRAIRLAG